MTYNLVVNGSFESPTLAPWSHEPLACAGEIEVTATSAEEGRKSLKFSPASRERWMNGDVYVEQIFTIPGEAEVLELYVKSGGPGSPGAFRVYFDQGAREPWVPTPLISGLFPDWTQTLISPPLPLAPVRGIRIVAQTSIPMLFDHVMLMCEGSESRYLLRRDEAPSAVIPALRRLAERLHRLEMNEENGKKPPGEKK